MWHIVQNLGNFSGKIPFLFSLQHKEQFLFDQKNI
jgi:hypothetical protein